MPSSAWAAEFRYDDEPIEALDKSLALRVADGAVAWCEPPEGCERL